MITIVSASRRIRRLTDEDLEQLPPVMFRGFGWWAGDFEISPAPHWETIDTGITWYPPNIYLTGSKKLRLFKWVEFWGQENRSHEQN